MALKTAASFVVSALLSSPRGEAFSPQFAAREMDMVSTIIPSNGRAAMNIPTSGGGGGGSSSSSSTRRASSPPAINRPRDRQQRQAAPAAPPSSTDTFRFSEGPGDPAADLGAGHEQRQHPASAFYFADDEDVVVTPHAPTTYLPGAPPAPLPEPGGGSVEGRAYSRVQHHQSGSSGTSFRSPYDRPWRKRARDSRRATVFRNTEGFEQEEEEEAEWQQGGAMRRRASEKDAVVASRKESQQKAITRAALPIVDLVGVVSPLVLLVGISVAQNVP